MAVSVPGMITIFTPSFADESDTNAQNLSVKEIVARLDPERAAVTMLYEGAVDPRIASRPNTTFLRWREHGNTRRTLWQILQKLPDVYFFPREGPLDVAFLRLRRYLRLKTAVVTYIVSGGLHLESYSAARIRNIREADTVIANNNYLAQLLKEKLDVNAETIYDGIDRRYFFPPDSERASRAFVTVLYAGSLRPYKRAPMVVQQAARFPQVQFRIAGVGEEEQICRNLAAELKCRNVEFVGHLSQSATRRRNAPRRYLFLPEYRRRASPGSIASGGQRASNHCHGGLSPRLHYQWRDRLSRWQRRRTS